MFSAYNQAQQLVKGITNKHISLIYLIRGCLLFWLVIAIVPAVYGYAL